jgi:hypothetical protein
MQKRKRASWHGRLIQITVPRHFGRLGISGRVYSSGITSKGDADFWLNLKWGVFCLGIMPLTLVGIMILMFRWLDKQR